MNKQYEANWQADQIAEHDAVNRAFDAFAEVGNHANKVECVKAVIATARQQAAPSGFFALLSTLEELDRNGVLHHEASAALEEFNAEQDDPPKTGINGDWYCERHPDKLMGHDGCPGAGIIEEGRFDAPGVFESMGLPQAPNFPSLTGDAK